MQTLTVNSRPSCWKVDPKALQFAFRWSRRRGCPAVRRVVRSAHEQFRVRMGVEGMVRSSSLKHLRVLLKFYPLGFQTSS